MRILSELHGTNFKEIVVRFRRSPDKVHRLHNVEVVRRGGSNGAYWVGKRFNPATMKRERVSVTGSTEVVKVPDRDKKRKRYR